MKSVLQRLRKLPVVEPELERAWARYLAEETEADELDREVGIALRVLEWGWEPCTRNLPLDPGTSVP